MKGHTFWMILACLIPLALFFLLPLFGLGSGNLLFVFLILCFVVHLLMMRGNHDGH